MTGSSNSINQLNQDDSTYSVWEINTLLKDTVAGAPFLQNISVTGEIIGLRPYLKGQQLFFNLSDGKASISCNCYLSILKRISFTPKDSITVKCKGNIIISQKKGTLMFHIYYMEQIGLGPQSLLFNALKKKLASEGIFDISNKKEVPLYPKKVGIITSWNSAAMWDFITILRQHAPQIECLVIPCTVQGSSAVPSVLDALTRAQSQPELDILTIIRGGGSPEDLATFNNEDIVRAIFKSKIPTITGIGHEVDYSLSDYASDHRSETPTAAATFIADATVQSKLKIKNLLANIQIRTKENIDKHHHLFRYQLKLIQQLMNYKVSSTKQHIASLMHQIEANNPIKKMKQGFAMVHSSSNKPIRSVHDTQNNEKIKITLWDGVLMSQIKDIQPLKDPSNP